MGVGVSVGRRSRKFRDPEMMNPNRLTVRWIVAPVAKVAKVHRVGRTDSRHQVKGDLWTENHRRLRAHRARRQVLRRVVRRSRRMNRD